MDILETTYDTSRRHALKRGLNHKMLSPLTIFPAPTDESFDEYIEPLNELDCRLRALATHTRNQHHPQAPWMLTPTAAAASPTTASTIAGTATGTAVGHFPAKFPARRTGTTAGTSGCRALAGEWVTMTPVTDSDSELGNEEVQEYLVTTSGARRCCR